MNLTRYIEVAVLMGLVVVSGIAAHQRNIVWKDDFSLWSDVVQKSPNKARPYNNLADACEKNGLIDRAILLARKSITLNPNLAEPHNNLGLCYLEKGWTDKAALEFKRAIRINPNLARAHSNLGLAYSRQGQKGMAIAQHKQALEVNPYFVDAHNNLGVCYFDKGRIDKAISHFQHAIKINSNHADAHYNLGLAYGSKGKHDMAFKEMRIAKRLSSSQQSRSPKRHQNQATSHGEIICTWHTIRIQAGTLAQALESSNSGISHSHYPESYGSTSQYQRASSCSGYDSREIRQ